jgi:hypothetical protein
MENAAPKTAAKQKKLPACCLQSKVVKNRPGLATVKCSHCGKVRLVPYQTREQYEELLAATKEARKRAVRHAQRQSDALLREVKSLKEYAAISRAFGRAVPK